MCLVSNCEEAEQLPLVEYTCSYFRNFSEEDQALIYGIVGGTPQYLLQINDRLSVEENIKNTFLNPTSSMFEEPEK